MRLARIGPRAAARRSGAGFEAGQTIVDVGDETHLSHLAIANNIETGLNLFPHHFGDGVAHLSLKGAGVQGLAFLLFLHHCEQLCGPRQAANVSGEDSVDAAFHNMTPVLRGSGVSMVSGQNGEVKRYLAGVYKEG